MCGGLHAVWLLAAAAVGPFLGAGPYQEADTPVRQAQGGPHTANKRDR